MKNGTDCVFTVVVPKGPEDPEDEKKPKVSSKNPGGFFSSSRSDDLSDFAVVRVIRPERWQRQKNNSSALLDESPWIMAYLGSNIGSKNPGGFFSSSRSDDLSEFAFQWG